MPVTYTPISAANGTGSSGTITFTSIPSTYTDLVLVLSGTATALQDTRIRVGTGSLSTTSLYSSTYLRGNGSTASSIRASGTFIQATSTGYPTTTAGYVSTLQFMNYSNTTTFKTILTRANNAGTGTDAIVSLWRATTAIDTISAYLGSGSWNTDFTATLYGIKSA